MDSVAAHVVSRSYTSSLDLKSKNVDPELWHLVSMRRLVQYVE